MGNRIKAERALVNMTQKQLAEKIGVSEPTMAKWENSIDDAPVSKVRAIAEVFGCSVSYILGLTEVRT